MSQDEMPKKLGRYPIVRVLGQGAMGIVYEGMDPNIGRRVAIKTARRDVMQSSGRGDEMMERFLREARAAGTLNHPNIIVIYDADEEDSGLAYIAMEFLDGRDLFKLFQEKHRLDAKEAVEIMATVCTALAHAHEHGIVHRDVKPSNIIMLNNGVIKVADFGIARTSDSNLTQEGAMIGTPHYMSPEQFMGQRVDQRSDLFSVGIILYEMLTGERPFTGEALSTVMHSVIRVTPIAPRELNFSVNDCLSKVVMKALSKDPNQRYQTGAAMAAALREALKPNPDPAITQVAASQMPEAGSATVVAAPPATTAATVISSPMPSTSLPTMPAARPAPLAEAGAAKESPAEAAAKPELKRRAFLLYGGIAAMVIFLGALVALLRPSSPSPPDSSSPTSSVKSYGSVVLNVWVTDDRISFNEAIKRQTDPDPKKLIAWVNETNNFRPGEASITIKPKDVSGKALPEFTETVRESSAPIEFKDTAAGKTPVGSFDIIAKQEGYADTSLSCISPRKPDDMADMYIILLKKGV